MEKVLSFLNRLSDMSGSYVDTQDDPCNLAWL